MKPRNSKKRNKTRQAPESTPEVKGMKRYNLPLQQLMGQRAESMPEVKDMKRYNSKTRSNTVQNNPNPFSINGTPYTRYGGTGKEEFTRLIGNVLPLDTVKGRNKLNEIRSIIENSDFGEDDSLVIGFDPSDPDLKIHTATISTDHFMGTEFARDGDNRKAALSFEKEIAKNPTNTQAHYSLGTVMRRMGRRDDAMKCFKKSVIADPNFALGYHDIGLEFMNLGNLEQAMWHMDHALKLNPDLSLAIFGKGVILSQYHKYEEAIFYFDRALQYDPDEPMIYEHKSGALMMLGKIDESMKCLDQLEEIDPDNELLHW